MFKGKNFVNKTGVFIFRVLGQLVKLWQSFSGVFPSGFLISNTLGEQEWRKAWINEIKMVLARFLPQGTFILVSERCLKKRTLYENTNCGAYVNSWNSTHIVRTALSSSFSKYRYHLCAVCTKCKEKRIYILPYPKVL